MKNIDKLQEKLGYTFNNLNLLYQAVTHRSYSKHNNERLEFVGDGILDYVIALNLFMLYPELSEGELSKMRASLVNQDGLVIIAQELNLSEFLLLGDGEIKSGGNFRPSILADAIEAIIAAILLDSNIEQCKLVIEKLFYTLLRKQISFKDYKTQLQEYLQSQQLKLPIYEVIATHGPEHDVIFTIECTVAELNLKASGRGKGKKQASQNAAQNLLIKLKELFKHE
ncbi:MAG: hypothetical protein RLZZ293_32 [Pseudomonadota bacterium]|jgi:ribonuclease-3